MNGYQFHCRNYFVLHTKVEAMFFKVANSSVNQTSHNVRFDAFDVL